MAYGKHSKPTVLNIIGSKSLYCQGKLDLLTEPSASKPISIERFFQSHFSQGAQLKSTWLSLRRVFSRESPCHLK
jgi:hypothetical protein